jgi:tRNA dimethylallyltransferase
MTRRRLVVICGPTGSGKGRLAFDLAERLGGEIILADSRKIYRGLDIGTAKPSAEQKQRVRYHLLDCCEPVEYFSAARYQQFADRAVEEIYARSRVAIVCGGTGLYIRSLLHGIIETPPRQPELRCRLEKMEQDNPGSLHRRLMELDQATAHRLSPRDMVRLVRALEVLEITGQPLSVVQAGHRFGPWRYQARLFAPLWRREELYRRLEERVDTMLRAGWREEVGRLLRQGLGETPALKTIGYRELVRELRGEISSEECRELIVREHRRYARRQGVWFRAEPGVEWLPVPIEADYLAEEITSFLRGDE